MPPFQRELRLYALLHGVDPALSGLRVSLLVERVSLAFQQSHRFLTHPPRRQIERFPFHLHEAGICFADVRPWPGIVRRGKHLGLPNCRIQFQDVSIVTVPPIHVSRGCAHLGRHGENFVEVHDRPAQLLNATMALCRGTRLEQNGTKKPDDAQDQDHRHNGQSSN